MKEDEDQEAYWCYRFQSQDDQRLWMKRGNSFSRRGARQRKGTANIPILRVLRSKRCWRILLETTPARHFASPLTYFLSPSGQWPLTGASPPMSTVSASHSVRHAGPGGARNSCCLRATLWEARETSLPGLCVVNLQTVE
ncbi:hypothetical protein J3E68DRAFT_112971 [Trichoderma sp. SZMC 28012]